MRMRSATLLGTLGLALPATLLPATQASATNQPGVHGVGPAIGCRPGDFCVSFSDDPRDFTDYWMWQQDDYDWYLQDHDGNVGPNNNDYSWVNNGYDVPGYSDVRVYKYGSGSSTRRPTGTSTICVPRGATWFGSSHPGAEGQGSAHLWTTC
jgi:hypothetical protein